MPQKKNLLLVQVITIAVAVVTLTAGVFTMIKYSENRRDEYLSENINLVIEFKDELNKFSNMIKKERDERLGVEKRVKILEDLVLKQKIQISIQQKEISRLSELLKKQGIVK